MEGPDLEDIPFEPYDVECWRCLATGPCTEFFVEEGNVWECPSCNDWLNKREEMNASNY